MGSQTREAMVQTAVQLLRERGADGVTLDAVLTRSGAPRGSIYHHFPGGRTQLLDEAVRLGGEAIASIIARSSSAGPLAVLDDFTRFWRKMLLDSDFAAGCPVVSVAVTSPVDSPLLANAQQIFTSWRDVLIDCFESSGLTTQSAQRLATISIAAIEGAVTLCRAHASTDPLDEVAAELRVLLSARAVFADRSAAPHPVADPH